MFVFKFEQKRKSFISVTLPRSKQLDVDRTKGRRRFAKTKELRSRNVQDADAVRIDNGGTVGDAGGGGGKLKLVFNFRSACFQLTEVFFRCRACTAC